MKEFWKNLKDWQKVGVVLGFLTLIAVIVVAIVAIINSEPKVEISFSEEVDIPGGELKRVRAKLVNVIRNNTIDFDSGIVYKGSARDYTESSVDDFKTANFVVDFDSISESYAVSVTWPNPDDGAPNIIISCPLLNSKYPETPCFTEVNSSSDIVGYLPYSGKLASGEEYKIVGRYDDNGELYVEVQVNSCGNETIMDMALTAAREWIFKIYLNPDDYLLYVPGDICENDGMMVTYPYLQANHAKTNDQNVNKFLPYYVPEAYNVYPVVDADNNVVSISAKVPGCYEYQMEPGKEFVRTYLVNHGINYPVEFLECE